MAEQFVSKGDVMAADRQAARDEVEVPDEGTRNRHNKSSRRRSNPQLTRKYLKLKKKHRELERMFLGTTIGLVVLTLFLGGWAFKATSNYRGAMHSRYLESEALKTAQVEIDATKAELAALVENRIPNLRTFAADEVIPIGESYVRNVAFTVARKEGLPIYEYKVVVSNETDIMVRPEIEILMFDNIGIEIGRSKVPVKSADGPVSNFTLYPNEVESYGSDIALGPNVTPSYFKVRID